MAKKTRRTNAKNQEEGEWEEEEDDDTPRGRAAAEADDAMTLPELRKRPFGNNEECLPRRGY